MKKKILAATVFFLSVLHLVLAQPASPEMLTASSAMPAKEGKISLDVKGMDIVDVLKIIANRHGLNIAIGKNVTGRITLFLKDVAIWDAFEIALLSNDLAYDTKGGIINVMTQRDYELLYGDRFQDKKQAKIIKLRYAKAADLSRALNQIKTNIGRIVVDEGSNTLSLIDSPGKIKEMEEFINKADMPLLTRVFQLNYAPADKLSAKLQESITKGVGSIKIDERTNKVIITDYPQRIEEIAKIIEAFDEKTPQVLIDAQIVEVSPKDEFAMGVDWDYWLKKNVRLISALPAPALTSASTIPNILAFGIAARNPSTATVGATDQFKSVLDLLRVIGKTKILSSPRIMALNNQEAKILVGTKEAYITSTTSQAGSGSTITSQAVNFVDVGIKLFVTPTINRDNFVTIKIRPEISSSVRTSIISEGQTTQIPIVTTSEAETTIMVKNGTTIMIAGLKRDKREKEVQKVPLLGDVPLLGYLFRNTKDEATKTELVIFITPKIVSGEETLEYESVTKDKDIARIQALALAKQEQGLPRTDPALALEKYKMAVFEKIKAGISNNNAKKLKGELTVSFTLQANGELKGEPRIVSSTNNELNALAKESLKQAAPFPPLPEGMESKEKTFSVVLSYG